MGKTQRNRNGEHCWWECTRAWPLWGKAESFLKSQRELCRTRATSQSLTPLICKMGVRITESTPVGCASNSAPQDPPRETKRPATCDCVTVTAHSSYTPKRPEGTHTCSRCDGEAPFIVRRNEGLTHTTTRTNVENICRGKGSQVTTLRTMTPFAYKVQGRQMYRTASKQASGCLRLGAGTETGCKGRQAGVVDMTYRWTKGGCTNLQMC